MPEALRIAFVKFGGLAAGGTERWLQMMAANLPRDRFAVDYFYCDSAPYIGSDFKHPDTDPDRLRYMEQAGIDLVKFHVGAKDVTTPTHDWVDTDFWDVFDARAYDLVQTGKAGPAEYPYDRLELPFVEYVTLSAGVDRSPNRALSIHLSQWQRRQWAAQGGDLSRSDVIPIPAEPPAAADELRDELGIPRDALVAGFHQRAQDEIFSPIPLAAFARVARPDRWFVVMGGSRLHREQAAELGLLNVVFVEHSGAAERISGFLSTLDVFAHGRRDGETFGTVFAEAMMHGKPCLSHRSEVANAQPETMGPAGLFALDLDDYAAKLDRLFDDDELSGRLARKARPHAERYYSLDSCVRRLAYAYDRLAGRDPADVARPMPYGQCDLGFLLAGAIDDQSSVAHHVVSGGIPQDPAASFIREAVPETAVHHEVGSANTTLALAARGKSRLYTNDVADAFRAAIALNNWEERVSVEPEPAAAELVRGADVVSVNAPEHAGKVDLAESSARPALLVNGTAPGLEPFGYRGRRLGRSDWVLYLHPDLHREFATALRGWRRTRRRARMRHAFEFPRRVRPRVGALVYRVRRALPF